MAIKTIDTENITPEMLAELGSSYLFDDENWPLAAIKAVLEAAPAVEPAPDKCEPFCYAFRCQYRFGPPGETVIKYDVHSNDVVLETIPLYTHPPKSIDAETRAMVLELCDKYEMECERTMISSDEHDPLIQQLRERMGNHD